MNWFWKKKEKREEQVMDSTVVSDPILRALLNKDEISRETALNIPEVSACVNKIADIVASLEVKLYRKMDNRIEEIKGDGRVFLLNHDTGDTLDATQFKKAMVTDMFLERGGYAYVNRVGREVRSIHYVEAQKIGFQKNSDPIFKDYRISVNGKLYEGWEFIKLLRNTRNGIYGMSIVEESPLLLNIVRSSQLFEKNLVKTGGNKKGFLQSAKTLSKDAMTALKTAFRNLYSNNSENVVILNDGLSFQEASNSSVELQLNENKQTNGNDVCKIFLIPPTIINGGSSEADRKQFLEDCIIPVLAKFESAINSVVLSEDEKGEYFFAFDTSDILKGDIEKRYKAYEIACKNGFMQLDEVRHNEKLPPFGLDFIKLGLQDVLYYPKTKELYTPNTNKLTLMGEETKKVAPVQLEGMQGEEDDPAEKGGEEGNED